MSGYKFEEAEMYRYPLQQLSEEDAYRFCIKHGWESTIRSVFFPQSFIRKYYSHWSMTTIKNRPLTEAIMLKYRENFNYDELFRYQDITEEFIHKLKYLDELVEG